MIASRHIAPVNYWGLTKQSGPWKTTAVDKTHEALGYDSPHNQVQEVRPYHQDGSKAPTYEQVEIVSENNINGLRGPGLREGKIQREGLSIIEQRKLDRIGDQIAKKVKLEFGTVGGDPGAGGGNMGMPTRNMGMPVPQDTAEVVARLNRSRARLHIGTNFRDPNSGAVVTAPTNSSAASSSVNSGSFYSIPSSSSTDSPGDIFGAGSPSSGSSFRPSETSTTQSSENTSPTIAQILSNMFPQQEVNQRLQNLTPDVVESPVGPAPIPTPTAVPVQLSPMNISLTESLVESPRVPVSDALDLARIQDLENTIEIGGGQLRDLRGEVNTLSKQTELLEGQSAIDRVLNRSMALELLANAEEIKDEVNSNRAPSRSTMDMRAALLDVSLSRRDPTIMAISSSSPSTVSPVSTSSSTSPESPNFQRPPTLQRQRPRRQRRVANNRNEIGTLRTTGRVSTADIEAHLARDQSTQPAPAVPATREPSTRIKFKGTPRSSIGKFTGRKR